jgi:hypothetical protein
VRLAQALRDEHGGVAAEHLGRGVAEKPLGRAVPEGDRPGGVDRDDGLAGGLGDGAEARLAVFEPLAGAPAGERERGQLGEGAGAARVGLVEAARLVRQHERADDLAADHRRAGVHEQRRPERRRDPPLDADAALERRRERQALRPERLAVVAARRPAERGELAGARDRPAQQLVRRRVAQDHVAARVGDEHGVVGRHHKGRERRPHLARRPTRPLCGGGDGRASLRLAGKRGSSGAVPLSRGDLARKATDTHGLADHRA